MGASVGACITFFLKIRRFLTLLLVMAGGRDEWSVLIGRRLAAAAGRDLKCYKIVLNMSHGNGSSAFDFSSYGDFKTSYGFYRQNATTFPLKHGMVSFTLWVKF